MASGVTVRGLREVQVLFGKAGSEANRDMKRELRSVAEPIRRDAEQFAASRITRIGPKWSAMRVGVTRKLVYVAPKQRGVGRGTGGLHRPKFANLLRERAMDPALDRNAGNITRDVEQMFDNLAKKWTRS